MAQKIYSYTVNIFNSDQYHPERTANIGNETIEQLENIPKYKYIALQ